MEEIMTSLEDLGAFAAAYISILRYGVPLVGLILLLRCGVPLLTFRREPEIWAWLNMAGGRQVPITHWENVIGRSKSSDVTIDLSTVSRNHAVLTRYDDGSWTITDAGSKDGVLVNGKTAKASLAVKAGDIIEIQFGNREVKAEILNVAETVRKDEAKDLFRYL